MLSVFLLESYHGESQGHSLLSRREEGKLLAHINFPPTPGQRTVSVPCEFFSWHRFLPVQFY